MFDLAPSPGKEEHVDVKVGADDDGDNGDDENTGVEYGKRGRSSLGTLTEMSFQPSNESNLPQPNPSQKPALTPTDELSVAKSRSRLQTKRASQIPRPADELSGIKPGLQSQARKATQISRLTGTGTQKEKQNDQPHH